MTAEEPGRAIKIAIMMRAMDQPTGRRFCIEGLIRAMLRMDHKNSYLLQYRDAKWLGMFSSHDNVKEVVVRSPHKLLWDQVAVPYNAWREGASVIYNPKFSVPLVSHCPVVMGLQEPAWWAVPADHTWIDVRYMRMMLPLYCRKASHFFPVSRFVLDENRKYLRMPFENATVAYNAPTGAFRSLSDSEELGEFRSRYNLPERFILGVTRVENRGNSGTSYCPTKNVETTLRAFGHVREHIPHKLVIAGRRIRDYLQDTGWKESDLEGIQFLGFVPHDELPMLYNAAEIFLLPSFYEGCPSTLLEALACGSRIISSKAGPLPELTNGAALLADPADPADFADKILKVARDESLREELQAKSLQRASFFSWERTAKVTLEALNDVARADRGGSKHL